jgi:CheY-like chemotaxis protein
MRETGGTLEVRLEEVVLKNNMPLPRTRLKPGRHLRLQVRDTGAGMTAEVLDHLFEPFFTTKPVGEGTGMGLSVVHGIIESHDGEITVESSPGKGTTFSVFFPSSEGKAAPDAAPPVSAAPPRGGERVMVVDDEQLLLDFVTETLKELGYRVSAYASSAEALEAFRSRPQSYDLLITDQTMPRMTGLQLAHACHLARPNMPIILCTGYSDSVTAESAQTEGIRSIALKPLDISDLGRLVHDALSGRGPA